VISVEAAIDKTCGRREEGIPIAKSSGYLSNWVTAETNKGSSACPWVLQGQPGQIFSLSLIDYGSSSVEDFVKQLAGSVAKLRFVNSHSDTCDLLVVIYPKPLLIRSAEASASIVFLKQFLFLNTNQFFLFNLSF